MPVDDDELTPRLVPSAPLAPTAAIDVLPCTAAVATATASSCAAFVASDVMSAACLPSRSHRAMIRYHLR